MTSSDPLRQIDILFMAWNRYAFTEESLHALRENTDWSLVRQLWLFDDGSTDDTATLVNEFAFDLDATHSVQTLTTNFHSPVAMMNKYLTDCEPAPWFAKIDNDVVLPPSWLPTCLDMLRRNPNLDLLGIEAIYPPAIAGPRVAVPCGHIGGIGLMRTAAFASKLPVAAGRLGFSDWQIKQPVSKAWLNPALPVILLDRLPFEPWAGLSAEYEAKGWQRPWKRYTDADAPLWAWWKK